jgi:hypothetical protein
MNRVLFALLFSSVFAPGSVTYQVTENASTCGEIRIPKWTRPARTADTILSLTSRPDVFVVDSHSCGYDLRKRGDTLLIGLSCGYVTWWRMVEKYSIDLARPEAVRLVDEHTWETATALDRRDGVWDAYLKQTAFPGRLGKSGPKWAGGVSSLGGSRAAEYSWSGTVRDPIGPLPYESSFVDWIGGRLTPWAEARYEGHYWTDIFDLASAKRLVQIRGEFHRESPYYFQGAANWFDGQFYLMPLEPNTPFRLPLKRDAMRHLLICDINAAAKAKGVVESDAPPLDGAKPYLQHSRSHYQMRFLDPETPQAHITDFQDEAVFYQGTPAIESVNVTAFLEVEFPGRYELELNLSGIEERTEADLNIGSAKLTVSYPVARLRSLGLGGPFVIRYARLFRLVGDGRIEADNRQIDARTRAYSLDALRP